MTLGQLKVLLQIERAMMRALHHNKVGDYHMWASKRRELLKGNH